MRGLVNGKKKRLTIRLTESAYRRLQALMSTTTMSASRIIDDAILQQPDPTLLINVLGDTVDGFHARLPIGVAIVQREMKREMEASVGGFKVSAPFTGSVCATCEGKGVIEPHDPRAQVFRCPDCRGVGRK